MNMKKALTLTVLVLMAAVPFVAAHEGHEHDSEVDTVVLASTANYPDAYVASAAAAEAGTPVLLTDQNQLPPRVSQALQSMNLTEVVVVGGESVVSSGVVSELESMGYEVTRLWGATRYITAVRVSDYFWPAGAEEAVLIENDRDDRRGNVLSLGKEVAQDRGAPVFLTPSGEIPADVLSQLSESGVEEVTVIGTGLSDSARSQLSDLGVSIREEIDAEEESEVEDRLRQRIAQRLNQSGTLNVVAAADFRHSIAAVNNVQANSFIVGNEEEIGDAVDAVNNRGVQQVRVVGQPDLAEQIATRLRAETDAEIRLAGFEAEEAVEFASNISEREREKWAQRRDRFRQEFEERRQEREEFLERRANNSLQEADELIDENSSEEARSSFVRARTAFDEGDYKEALRFAAKARSIQREGAWEDIRRDRQRIDMRVRNELESLDDKVDEVRQRVSFEFGEEMSGNMTVEERLEVLREIRGRRIGEIQEMYETAKELRGGDWRKRIRRAGKELRDFESEIETECGNLEVGSVQEFDIKSHDGEVETEGVVGLSDPGYRGNVDYVVDVNGSSVQFDVVYTRRSRAGTGFIQCTAESEFETRLDVPSGDWDVTTTVSVDNETVDEMSATVTVAEEEHEDEEEVRRKFRREFEERREELREDMEENNTCRNDVAGAREASQGAVCTQQIMTMECPDDDDYTYEATDGCQISHLRERGWEPVEGDDDMEEEMNETDDEETNESAETLPTSFRLESTDGDGCDTETFYYNGSAVDEITVPAGEEVTVTFAPRVDCTYGGGAQFYSDPDSVFGESEAVQGGETTSVSFTAQEDFEIEQYWPGESVFKADVDVNVE